MSRSARRVLAVCLLLAVAAVACDDGGRPGPPSETTARGAVTTAPGGELPAGYLDDTLDLIRQRAFYADRVDWPAVRVEARRRAGASASRTATYDAIRWVLSELGDRHSFLLTPEEARTLAAGQGLGFGLVALFPERVVVDVEPGGGAGRAGVRVGDLVESVDDRPVEGDEVVRLPPAEVGSKPAQVVLVLRRQAGDGARRLRVTVEAAKAAAVRSPTARRLPSGAAVLELFGVVTGSGPDGVRYVDAAHDAIRRVATRRTCGWVVDLRRNTGGSLPPMLVAAGPILGGGNAVGYRGRDGTAIWWGYEDGALVMAGQPGGSLGASRPARLPRPRPVTVLTSRLTGSAGEGVAMAFRGRPATRSFGEPTAGVPTGNAGHRLPDGAELYLTEGIGVDRTGRPTRRGSGPTSRWRPTGPGTPRRPTRSWRPRPAGWPGAAAGGLETGAGSAHARPVENTGALSSRRDMFLDERGAGLRVTWHPERDLVVLSVWQGDSCVGTFRMLVQDVPRLSGLLAAALGDWVGETGPGASAGPGAVGSGPGAGMGPGTAEGLRGGPGAGVGPGTAEGLRGGLGAGVGPGAVGAGPSTADPGADVGSGAGVGPGTGVGPGAGLGQAAAVGQAAAPGRESAAGGARLSVQQRLRLSRPVLKLRRLQHRRRGSV